MSMSCIKFFTSALMIQHPRMAKRYVSTSVGCEAGPFCPSGCFKKVPVIEKQTVFCENNIYEMIRPKCWRQHICENCGNAGKLMASHLLMQGLWNIVQLIHQKKDAANQVVRLLTSKIRIGPRVKNHRDGPNQCAERTGEATKQKPNFLGDSVEFCTRTSDRNRVIQANQRAVSAAKDHETWACVE